MPMLVKQGWRSIREVMIKWMRSFLELMTQRLQHFIKHFMCDVIPWNKMAAPYGKLCSVLVSVLSRVQTYSLHVLLRDSMLCPLHGFWVVMGLLTTFWWHYFLLPIRVLWMLVSSTQACLVTCLYHLLARPLLYVCPDIYWAFSGYFHIGMQIYVASFMRFSGFKLSVAGADMRRYSTDRCLLLPNHKAPADAAILAWSMLRSLEGAHSVMWIFSSMFKHTYFGWTCRLQGDYPVSEGKSQEQRDKQRDNLTTFMRTWFVTIPQKKWIVLFPEGGFLHNRKAKSQEYAQRHNYPLLDHVALPRIGATKGVLDALSPKKKSFRPRQTYPFEKPRPSPLSWIADVTIAYPGGHVISLYELLSGRVPSEPVVLCYRTFPASEVPLNKTGLTHWLNDRFTEKNMMLEDYYTTGAMPLILPNNSPQQSDSESDDENNNTKAGNSAYHVTTPELTSCPPVSIRQVVVTFVSFGVAFLLELRILFRLYSVLLLMPYIIMSLASVL